MSLNTGYPSIIDSRPLGIGRDDLDDFEAVVDQKLRLFLIVVNGEQGIVLLNAEDQLIRGGTGAERAGFGADWENAAAG